MPNRFSRGTSKETAQRDFSRVLPGEDDQVYEFDNILNDKDCKELIRRATPNLFRSKVMGGDKGVSNIRTSSQVFLYTKGDPLLKKIDNIVYNFLKIPKENYEALQVVNYKKDQLYKPHYDACTHGDVCERDLLRGGPRYATFIIYLNDDFTGGETEFPIHGKKVVPKKGKAILFFNLDDDNIHQRKNSFHGGLPPIKGEKWMCNKWIRLGKFV